MPFLQCTVCGECEMRVYSQRSNLLWLARLAKDGADIQDPLVVVGTAAFIYSALHSLHSLQSF